MNSSTQPTDVYGGDEVAAIILDPGYSSVRAGFAGEDTPKSFLNSYYGRTKDGRNLFGDDAIHNPLVELEIQNPMSNEGIVEDWDVATKLWEYAVTSRLTSYKPSKDQKDYLNDDTKDMDTEMEGVNEIAMESWGCPAFWLARNSVLSGFGAGKATALIVDIGASTSSTVAIHDGLILKKSIQKSPLAGNWLSSQIRILLSLQNPPVNIIPHFMIASKVPVEQNAPSQATFRQPKITHTESFRSLEQERVITEFKESVVQVWPGPTRLNGPAINGGSNYDIAKSQPGRIFEFPDGSNRTWAAERFSVAEGFYDEKAALLFPGETQPSKAHTLPEMVKASVSGVDMDIRASLLQNIVVVGGTSLTLGLVERLEQELKNIYPGARIKINAAGLTSERRFGSWIGGSILGSLGTFHQMWISRKEYDEFGANIVEKRCK
ncbi:Actin-related protein [Blumeria hordei DH14]|uniref:Actin-related protein n=1 Tax=Blumeria graminis f. sp. hordei (strain DH14) TaxID=546991 RepID=N1JF32_BLUG1|nr:Actin-related protein [Blumeria hordei DH14]